MLNVPIVMSTSQTDSDLS